MLAVDHVEQRVLLRPAELAAPGAELLGQAGAQRRGQLVDELLPRPARGGGPVPGEADPALPIIRMTRDFDATPAQLMRAHTDPELFVRWVGPNGMETKILDWDATTGGRWRYVAGRDGEEQAGHR